MSDELHARNGHEDLGADAPLPPDFELLAARLAADGAAWQRNLPDPARAVERIQAIPHVLQTSTLEGRPPVSGNVITDLPNPPRGRRPSSRDGGQPSRPNRRGPVWGLVAAVIVVGLLATVLVRLASQRASGAGQGPQPTATPAPAVSPTPASQVVLVYFSKRPDSLNDPNAIFPVQRTTTSSDVATFAIQQLIAGPTAAEIAQGYFTEVTAALSGPSDCGGADFSLTRNTRGSTPQTGTATLRFCRSLQLPGEMTDPRIKAEITKTLTQFPGISSVVILTREGHCLGDLSGADRCLH